jgi:phospholipid N-methyltransferase
VSSQKGVEKMTQNQVLVSRILKIVALGMGTAVIVLSIMQVATMETSVTMLSIGLFALALDALQGMNIGGSK